MTEKKEAKKEPKHPRLNPEERERIVAEEIKRLEASIPFGRKFAVKTWRVFTGTIYCISVAFFSFVFAVLAAVVLPVLLPAAYVIGLFRKRPWPPVPNG